MHNPARLIVYSSSAIVLLVLLWGFRQIPQQGQLADQALRESLHQEMVVLTGAVKASTQALKYRLLDVLKAEGNDHATRAFQESPFIAATLLEWDQVQWKSNWFSVKTKNLFQNGELKAWMKEWPLSRLGQEEVYYTKVAEIQGQSYFAILVPVRKPNMIPMVGVGIFPANQFGMAFSAEENRELRVFTQDGVALALSHPAYLGSSLKSEPLIQEILTGEDVSLRHDWSSERGPMIGLAEKIGDSNLYAAIETRAQTPSKFAAWFYLLFSAAGAILLNWVLFKIIFSSIMAQLEQSEHANEHLRRQLNERTQVREPVVIEPAPVPVISNAILPEPELSDLEFAGGDDGAVDESAETSAQLDRIITASLRALAEKINERGINVVKHGLDDLQVSGDSLQLQTAVEEILKNAIEAISAESQKRDLTIVGRNENGVIHLIVQDSGTGIPANHVDKVFDPFFSTKDSEGVARGLGLNVVRRVVEEMQGRVILTSTQDVNARGTRVEIQFPLNAEAAVALELGVDDDELVPGPSKILAQDMPPPLNWDVIRKPKVRTLD